jgi:hypothetical protein
VGTCLPNRCLAMDYSGFQAACHNIMFQDCIWTERGHKPLKGKGNFKRQANYYLNVQIGEKVGEFLLCPQWGHCQNTWRNVKNRQHSKEETKRQRSWEEPQIKQEIL